MMKYLAAYAGAAVAMAVLDALWLGTTVPLLYRPAIGELLAARTNMAAGVLFYLLYVAGVVVFAVAPALRGGGWTAALTMGAGFRFFAYITYDLTNLATLRVWPVHLAVLDVAWGTVLTLVASAAGYFAARPLA